MAVVKKPWQLVRGDIFEGPESECEPCGEESLGSKSKERYWVRTIQLTGKHHTEVLAVRESDSQLMQILIAVWVSLLVIENKPIPADPE